MLLTFFYLTCSLVAAQDVADLTPEEIGRRATAHSVFGFSNASATVVLHLQKGEQAQRTRQLEVRSCERGGTLKTMLRFRAPADVAGTAFLVVEKKNDEDESEQYLYLPALAKVKRITGSQRDEKFMGTDLSYADIQGKGLKGAKLSRDSDVALAGQPTYVINAMPNSDEDSPYSKITLWIDQTSFMPMRIEFFDKEQRLKKIMVVQHLEKLSGQWVASQSEMRDVISASTTTMQVSDIKFSKECTASDFTTRALAGG